MPLPFLSTPVHLSARALMSWVQGNKSSRRGGPSKKNKPVLTRPLDKCWAQLRKVIYVGFNVLLYIDNYSSFPSTVPLFSFLYSTQEYSSWHMNRTKLSSSICLLTVLNKTTAASKTRHHWQCRTNPDQRQRTDPDAGMPECRCRIDTDDCRKKPMPD